MKKALTGHRKGIQWSTCHDTLEEASWKNRLQIQHIGLVFLVRASFIGLPDCPMVRVDMIILMGCTFPRRKPWEQWSIRNFYLGGADYSQLKILTFFFFLDIFYLNNSKRGNILYLNIYKIQNTLLHLPALISLIKKST